MSLNKVVLFGATGQTGTNVWRQAVAQGHNVTALSSALGGWIM